VVEVQLDLAGYPVILADTAGLRELDEEVAAVPAGQRAIEREGMARARERATRADVTLLLVDLEAAMTDASGLDAVEALYDSRALVLLNKVDRCDRAALSAVLQKLQHRDPLVVSAKTGEGLDTVLARLAGRAADALGGPEEGGAITRVRHRRALEDCRDALMRAGTADLPELKAEELRLAVRAVGRIGGRVDVEDLLDIVFRDFCIGK